LNIPSYDVNWGTLWADDHDAPDRVAGSFDDVKDFVTSGLDELIGTLTYVRETLQKATNFDDLDELESWEDLIEIRKEG
jgi:hypothetical protein